MALPPVVSRQEWAAANEAQLTEEKAHTRAGDALSARRRRLPMTEMATDYEFTAVGRTLSFTELFDGRSQLIVYSFMLTPGEDHVCPGCSMFTDNLPELAHVRARDTTFVLSSRVPWERLSAVREEMGWQDIPWVSAQTRFHEAIGATVEGRDTFRYSVFLRDGDRIFLTYATAGRGTEALGSTWGLIDSTPFGRAEEWQDSPAGWPQEPAYSWWRRHVEYDDATRTGTLPG